MESLKPEHANKIADISGAPRFQIRRWLTGYAYAANGNVGNPTPRYQWHLLLDGRLIDQSSRRRSLIEAARQPNAVELYTDESAEK